MPLMRVIALCLLLLLPRLGEAAVLFSQPPVDGGAAYYADRRDIEPAIPLADDFTFSTYTSLTELRWWGAPNLGPQPVDDFLIEFYEGPLSSHALPFYSFTTPAVRSPTALHEETGLVVYEYHFALPVTFTLHPGTYYVGIRNKGGSQNEWFWQIANGASFWIDPQGPFSGESWQQQAGTPGLSFEIYGVPEPSETLCVGAALMLLALVVTRGRILGTR